MATNSTVTVIPMTDQLRFRNRPRLRFAAGYWVLIKPKVNLLIATTVVAGFRAARHTTLQSSPYVRSNFGFAELSHRDLALSRGQDGELQE